MTQPEVDRGFRRGVVVEQAVALGSRAVINSARSPWAWVPTVLFALLLAAVYSSQFSRATDLPGFPEVDSFLQFILPATILQGVSFIAGDAATAMATDIRTGFFDRLLVSPTHRSSIFIGRLAGAAVFSGLLATVLMVVFALLGSPVQGGLLAAAVIIVIAAFVSVAIGGFSLAVAIRTGSTEATRSMFPLTFAFIFVSSAFFPTELMDGWYQRIAELNPFTLIVNPTRRLAIDGFSWADTGQALGWVALVASISWTLSYRAYVARLRNP